MIVGHPREPCEKVLEATQSSHKKIKGSVNSEMRLQSRFLSFIDGLFEVLRERENPKFVESNLENFHIYFRFL